MERLLNNAERAAHILGFIPWLIAAVLLVLVGFELDTVTAVGHHALLIGGGIALGIGIGRNR